VHRLDRATSGVLLFALDPEAADELSAILRAKQFGKKYLAVVRGFTDEQGEIATPLRKNFEAKNAPPVEAFTRYRRLATAELPHPVGRYASARYSLLEVEPLTGRRHQIRRHLASIAHPVLGDTVRGDGRHNKFLRETLGLHRLLLHADQLQFFCPIEQKDVQIKSLLTPDFMKLISSIFPD
jgi:tRNA pseudouridine65 synthase